MVPGQCARGDDGHRCHDPPLATREIPAGEHETDFIVNPNAPLDDQTTLGLISQLNPDHQWQKSHLLFPDAQLLADPERRLDDSVAQYRFGRDDGPGLARPRRQEGDDFTSHVVTARTITTPGTAQQVITVGEYQSKGIGRPLVKGDLA